MEPTDQYNFSIFRPRNLHGKKNRNVILSMLLIWVVAVFGFQLLLKGIQEPTPEKSLLMFESTWPEAVKGTLSPEDFQTYLRSLVLVRGKNTVKAEEQDVISEAITVAVFGVVPDSIKSDILLLIANKVRLNSELAQVKDQEYLNIKKEITEIDNTLIRFTEPYSGFSSGSLEATLLISSLRNEYPEALSDKAFTKLPQIMKLYLIHNQSKLTDTKFLGFPFHYFYTAVFLLILFIILCIVYNILIEWRLKKQGVIE